MMKNITRNRALSALTLLFVFLIFVAILPTVDAKIFVSTSLDTQTLYTDEIASLTIEIIEDGKPTSDVLFRVEGSEGIVFPENDDASTYVTEAEVVNEHLPSAIHVRIRAVPTKKSSANILVYYGNYYEGSGPLPYVSGTYVALKEKPALVKATAVKRLDPEGEKVVIDFSLVNNSGQELRNVMAEVIAPQGFDVKTKTLIIDSVADGNSVKRIFEVLAPLEVTGTQKVVLSYGYMDSNGPHYFEKTFPVSFAKSDNSILLIVGIIVLIVAVLIYVRKTRAKPEKEVVGTSAKKK